MILNVIIISITIIIIIAIIIAIIINSTKDDIWDMNELFHKLTNFGEQSSSRVSKKRGKRIFTFYFLSTIIHKNSSSYWIVKELKDGVSCIYILLTGWIGHCSVLCNCTISDDIVYWKKLRNGPLFCPAASLWL